MPLPPIFGVEGRGVGNVVEYAIGPGRAAIIDREAYRMSGPRFDGVWQVSSEGGGHATLCRISGDTESEVAERLELWLRLWLTSWGKALGVEMREVGP